MLFLGCLFAFVWMVLAWLIYLCWKNAAVVDLAWTFCVGGISLIYFLFSDLVDSSLILSLILMMCWTARLGFLVAYRLTYFGIDGRYEALDESFKERRNLKYFFFFLMQGAAAVVITLPIWILASYGGTFVWWQSIAAVISLVGLCGVITSDMQLQLFIRKESNKGKVCQRGLWKYSRHPNYFFEWVYWMGIATFALPHHLGPVATLSPIMLIVTLLFFTGIPAAEKQSLRSKGDAYRDYQRRTSPFIPWFQKKG